MSAQLKKTKCEIKHVHSLREFTCSFPVVIYIVCAVSINDYLCSSLTIGVPHLFLSLLHVSKVIDDRLRQVLQSPQLDLERLQLLHLGNLRGQSRCYHNHLRSQERQNYSLSSVTINFVQQVSLLDCVRTWRL